jgi:hypothetical protein
MRHGHGWVAENSRYRSERRVQSTGVVLSAEQGTAGKLKIYGIVYACRALPVRR